MKSRKLVHIICHKRYSDIIGVFSSYSKALAYYKCLEDSVYYEIRSRRLL